MPKMPDKADSIGRCSTIWQTCCLRTVFMSEGKPSKVVVSDLFGMLKRHKLLIPRTAQWE
jgi:hypothetical protein